MIGDDLGIRIRKRLEQWGLKLNAEKALPLFVFATDEKGKPVLLADGNMTTEEVRVLVKGLAKIIDQGIPEVVEVVQ